MAKKKSQKVQMLKKDSSFVGTIKGNDLLINAAGKINSGSNPELRTKVHKSPKDYDRKQNKKELRSQVDNYLGTKFFLFSFQLNCINQVLTI